MDHSRQSPFTFELTNQIKRSHFYNIYQGDPESRIIAETANFAVIVDIAPLVAGHLLIIPKLPYFSFATIPETLWHELLSLKSLVEINLKSIYSEPVFLEHGSCSSMLGGGCVLHAHWQVIPAPINLLPDFEKNGFAFSKIEHEQELIRWAKLNVPYIYYESVQHGIFVATNVENIRRQYLRIHAARYLGIPDPYWDWDVHFNKEMLRKTVKELSILNWTRINLS